ncbi:proteoglycan 4-like [Physella acuta]|uniref:proteoglycan 4-like n=1 Tax=Physella acuta TaxID=109671 RepID=UPI0027DCDED0|nr:proteoglycan 4-like [Physella acuta]
MADSSGSRNSCRESTMYAHPEMEGFLEKKGTGVIIRKTKTFCSLQGSTLYLKKTQGVMDTLDVSDAHQVKKINSDSTGTSFEIIIKKKSHIFICSSSEECSSWVKALHTAMAFKDSGVRSSTFYTTDLSEDENGNEGRDCVYTTISDEQSKATEDQTEAPYKVSDYADPIDAQPSTPRTDPVYYDIQDSIKVTSSDKVACPEEQPALPDQVYEDVVTYRSSRVSDFRVNELESSSNGYSVVTKQKDESKAHTEGSSVAPPASTIQVADDSIYSDASTEAPVCSVSAPASSLAHASATSPPASTRSAPASACSPPGSAKSPPASALPPPASPRAPQTSARSPPGPAMPAPATARSPPSIRSPPAVTLTGPSESLQSQPPNGLDHNEGDPFSILVAALNETEYQIPELIHPLCDQDRKPLDDLKTFLATNKSVCRVSCSTPSTTEDPISQLKAVLAAVSARS